MPTIQVDEKFRKLFGARIKALRNQHGWTLKELGAKLGVRAQQLFRYEGGHNLPPGEKLVILAELFDTTIDYLLTGSRAEVKPLHNLRLLDRFEVAQDFDSETQELIIRVVDAFRVERQVAVLSDGIRRGSRSEPQKRNGAETTETSTADAEPEEAKGKAKRKRKSKRASRRAS